MNKVSFEEIGAVAATFFAQKEVKAGQVVKMTGNGQVGPCSAGDKFCGVALSNENGCAGVQVKGFCPVAIWGGTRWRRMGPAVSRRRPPGPKSPHLGWSVWWSVRTRRASAP